MRVHEHRNRLVARRDLAREHRALGLLRVVDPDPAIRRLGNDVERGALLQRDGDINPKIARLDRERLVDLECTRDRGVRSRNIRRGRFPGPLDAAVRRSDLDRPTRLRGSYAYRSVCRLERDGVCNDGVEGDWRVRGNYRERGESWEGGGGDDEDGRGNVEGVKGRERRRDAVGDVESQLVIVVVEPAGLLRRLRVKWGSENS